MIFFEIVSYSGREKNREYPGIRLLAAFLNDVEIGQYSW